MSAFRVLQFNMQFGQSWDGANPDHAPVNLDLTIAEIRSPSSTTRSVPRITVTPALAAAAATRDQARSRNAASTRGTSRLISRYPGTKHSGKQMMSARSAAACVTACSASVIDSSGVAGNRMLARAIRTVLM